MKSQSIVIPTLLLILYANTGISQSQYPVLKNRSDSDEIINQLSEEYMPVMGVWNMRENELEPEEYKKTLDRASEDSPFNLLIPFLRFSDKEVVDDVVYNAVKGAAEYAVEKNLALVPDLDVRLARRAFQQKYPEELQEMLRIREVSLSQSENVETSIITIKNHSDHYTGGDIPKYYSLQSSLLRVYAYSADSIGIDPESLEEITDICKIIYSSEDSVRVSIPPLEGGKTHASVMLSFTIFYPDIFAPHLMEFQRNIIEQYANVPLAGACKDEWGFPPYFPRYAGENTYDFWYSRHRAEKYAERTNGRELLKDCLLMARNFKGKEMERQVAINHFREMSLQRNVELENDFYDGVKDVFGPDAAVTVHPTWWPYPDQNEMKKNGLDWWAAKRDWAQTDEIVPFGARTAMSKKWGSSIWYHMYYTNFLSTQVWSSVLAGGRINYLSFQRLYDPEVMRAENRIRLLNPISQSPMDCPVAVIFGHHAAMNWTSPHFDDVGMDLQNLLWNSGYPADLIPSSEIDNGSLKLDNEGRITYGDQKYAAIVLYHPEFDKKSTSDFFLKAANSKTAMFRVGDWTKDFYGQTIDANQSLPETMILKNDYRDAYLKILEILKDQNISPVTPATEDLDSRYFTLRDFNKVSKFPPTTGFSRLIDGTVIHIAGTNDISGDPIQKEFEVNGNNVKIDAMGVAAVRLDDDGNLEALAAGSLKSFQSEKFELILDKRVDLALWKGKDGKWKGIVQGYEGDIPKKLLSITKNWERIKLPSPPENSER